MQLFGLSTKSKVQPVHQRDQPWNAASAFANCGLAVAHTSGAAMGQHAKSAFLLDHRIGSRDQTGRYFEASALCGLYG